MSGEDNSEEQRCFDCKKTAPATDTNYTLISKTHGWRLERRHENGGIVLEWRCPDCWQRFKARPPAAKTADAKPPRRP